MTVNERVRELRKAVNLTQVEFGERIRVSQGHLTSIETGARSVTDKLIKFLCLEFGVSELWLETGEGSMFDDSTDELEAIANQLNLNPFQLRLLRIVHDMPMEQQKIIRQIAHQLAGDDIPETDAERTKRIARAALAEHDRQQSELPEDKQA